MITPFDCEDLFEINESVSFKVINDVVYIDNFYKNFDEILRVLNNTSSEKWKKTENSRNFIDYYDCRVSFLNHYPNLKKMNRRIEFYYEIMKKVYGIKMMKFNKEFYFNFFKNKIENLSTKFQFVPHTDGTFNAIQYLDLTSDGGTAIYDYENVDERIEEKNIFYDVSNMKIINLIESVPNRCVIFDGKLLHGGYIKNHNAYLNNWRINCVSFIEATL